MEAKEDLCFKNENLARMFNPLNQMVLFTMHKFGSQLQET